MIEEAGFTRLQGSKFFLKEIGLGFALGATFARVDIERVIGQGNVLGMLAGFDDGFKEFAGIDHFAVINKILQMIGIPTLARLAEDDHCFGNENARTGFSCAFIEQLEAVVQCFDFLSDESRAILGADGEQALPTVFVKAAFKKFDGHVTGQCGISTTNGFLQATGDFKEIEATPGLGCAFGFHFQNVFCASDCSSRCRIAGMRHLNGQ